MKISKAQQLFVFEVVISIVTLFAIYNISQIDLYIDGLGPIIQFLFVQGVFYGLLYYWLQHISGKKHAGKISLGVVIFVMGIDLITPPYDVLQNGQLVAAGTLGKGAIDYFFGYIGQTFLGITGNLSFTLPNLFFGGVNFTVSWLYLFTYPLCAIILVIIAMFLEPNLRKKAT